MKKILVIVISFLFIGLIFGYSQNTVKKVSSTPKPPEFVSPIVGTWKYYKDVPDVPTQKTWTLFFNKDGTYTTEGDTIKYKSDKAKNSTGSSHADTWGAKGKYTVSEDAKTITMTREDKGTIVTRNYEIKDENGEKQLVFKDDSGEVSVATIGEDKTLYYTIFIKQK